MKLIGRSGGITGQPQTEPEKIVVDQKGEKDIRANVKRVVAVEPLCKVNPRLVFFRQQDTLRQKHAGGFSSDASCPNQAIANRNQIL